MQTVEPANAGSAITGPVTSISSTATAMKVSLPTDIGVLNVRVIKTPDGWKVAGYEGKAEMRKLVVAVVVLAGFAGLVGIGGSPS